MSLQSDVVSWGHTSFGGVPLLYLQVLLLTQQFEQAVAYWWNPSEAADAGDLSSGPRGVEAVNLLLAVMDAQRKTSSKNLINVKPATEQGYNELLSACGNGTYSLDVGTLLEEFTKQFHVLDPKLAMYYLAMMPQSHSQKRIESIVNLAVETREYGRLFLTKRPRRNFASDDNLHRADVSGIEEVHT